MKLFPLLFLFLLSFTLASQSNQSTSHLERIVLGSGCFWGAEKGYEALPGVVDAVSGYADGYGVRPSYREITKYINKFNPNNHAEVVEVTYNKNIISTKDLLEHYFESHDPTQLNRQGFDIGSQYRSVIYFYSETQKKIAISFARAGFFFPIRKIYFIKAKSNPEDFKNVIFNQFNKNNFMKYY